MDYWGLATLKPMSERIAEQNLTAQGFEFYNPKIMERRLVRGRIDHQPTQLFPGYLFVWIARGFESISGTKGIASLIMCGELPSRMRDKEISNIRSQEVEGFVLLPDKRVQKNSFFIGQAVYSVSGHLINRIGLYSGARKGERVRVLYQMMGQSVVTYVRESDLVAA